MSGGFSGGQSTTKTTPYGPAIPGINTVLNNYAPQAFTHSYPWVGRVGNPWTTLRDEGYAAAKDMGDMLEYGDLSQRRAMENAEYAAQDWASGKYVRGPEDKPNPYLQQSLDALQYQIRNDAMSRAIGAGRELSPGALASMAGEQQRAMAPLLFQNAQFNDQMRNQERQQQLAATGLLGQIGQGYASNAAALGQGYGNQVGAFGNWANAMDRTALNAITAPWLPVNYFSNIFNSIGSAYPTIDSSYSGWNVGFGMSDRKAKTDIEAVGKTFDGQTIYRFRYKGDPEMRLGLMADEVKEVHPEAVHTKGMFDYVDYVEATDDAVIEGAFS